VRFLPTHVVITGASSGIGAALAQAYSRTGRRLSLIARDRLRTEEIARNCRALGAEVDIYLADVTDAGSISEAVLRCDRRQPVDLLLANAGIGGRDSLAGSSGEPGDVGRRIFATNTIGVINTITPLLPLLVARRSGQIAIVSSLAALIELPSCPVYCASKAAVRVYGIALRRLLANSGLHVSVICAGFVATPMSAGLPFRPPFLWTADYAAQYIVQQLEKCRAEIRFPWQLTIAVRILKLLPSAVADSILVMLQH
jgi:short-subunit dehydrogenase